MSFSGLFTEFKQELIQQLSKWDLNSEIYILRDMDGFVSLYFKDANDADWIRNKWNSLISGLGDNRHYLTSNPECLNDYKPDEQKIIIEGAIELAKKIFWIERAPKLDSWFLGQKTDKLKSQYVIFYSYKGGVGRSTLAAFTAMQLSQNHKVLIIDADLEAPGLLWQFYSDEQIAKNFPQKGGLTDAIMAMHLNHLKRIEKPLSLNFKKDFLFGGDNEYPSLWILGAGNIRVESEYFQSLARIQTFSAESMYLVELLQMIEQELEPDIVIFDSRTGFCDMAGVLLRNLSDFAVFVGYPDSQTRHGLNFFSSQMNGIQLDQSQQNVEACPVAWVHSPCRVLDGELDPNECNLFNELVAESLIGNVKLQPAFSDYEETNKKDFVDGIFDNFKNIFHVPLDADVRSIVRKFQIGGFKSRSKFFDIYTKFAKFLQTELALKDPGAVVATEMFSEALKELKSSDFQSFGTAESEFNEESDIKLNYYPLPKFWNIFQPQKFLVLGSKGSGKTALEKILRICCMDSKKLLNSHPMQTAHKIDLSTQWIPLINEANYPKISDYSATLREFSADDWKKFWFLFVIRTLERNAQLTAANDFAGIFSDLKIYTQPALSLRLEQLNHDRTGSIFLATDKLDDLFQVGDSQLQAQLIQSLITFWWDQSQIPHVKIFGKVFLRNDLFDSFRHPNRGHMENSCSVDLHFSFDELIAMVIKRLCARAPKLLALIQNYTNTIVRYDDLFGYIPDCQNEIFIDRCIEIIFGKKITQAKSRTWLERYLSDARSNPHFPPRFALLLLKELIPKSDAGEDCLFRVKKAMDQIYPKVAKTNLVDEFHVMYPHLKPILEGFQAKQNLQKNSPKFKGTYTKQRLLGDLKDIIPQSKHPASGQLLTLEVCLDEMEKAGLIYTQSYLDLRKKDNREASVFPEMYRVALGIPKQNSIPPAG